MTSEDRKQMMERRAQAILRAHFTPDEARRALDNFEVFDVTDLDARLIYSAHGSVAFTDWTHALATQLGSVTGTILDPLARFVAGSENDAEVATHLIRAGEHIAAGTSGAVLITHHPNKASMRTGNVDGTEGRGSGGFRGGARSQLRLIALSASDASGIGNASRDMVDAGNLLALYHTKLNDGQKALRALMTREADGTFRQFIPQTAEPREALLAWLSAQGKPLSIRAMRDAYREWAGTLARDPAHVFLKTCTGNGVLVAVDDKTSARYLPGTIAEPAIDPFSI